MLNLILLEFVAAPGAWAASVTFCATYQTNYADSDMNPASGEDYFYTNADKVARGARIRARPTDLSGDEEAFAEWDDGQSLNPGCATLTLNDIKVYDIYIDSIASVRGNTVEIRNNYTDEAIWASRALSAYIPNNSDVINIVTANTHRAWNAAAAIGHALYRRDGGLNRTYLAYTHMVDSSIWDGTKLLMGGSPPFSDLRIGLAHEIGHLIGRYRDEDAWPAANYGANQNGCHYEIGDLHEMQEKDFQSAAATEGWAHFFAAVVYNSTTQTDCGFVYYEEQDYDLDGFPESADPHVLNCESGPSVVTAKDYYSEVCEPLAGVHENRAVPLDWLRFWWDFVSEEAAVEFSDCIDILDLADPRTWNAIGDIQDSCTSLTDACNPADRFLMAAHDHLVTDADWDDHLDNGNGR
jgi:hypothetical protein